MFTEPCLVGDTNKLVSIWREEEKERSQLLDQLSVSGSDLRSNETFAELLRAEGIEPPLKKTTAGEAYAFAKTDQFMRDLQDDDRIRVSALASARLAQRSNIVQTRSKRLAEMSTRGPLPVYLAPNGAHTTRWSGGDKLNWQNFPRDSDLGGAIQAPPGYLNVIRDASQIECRLLNYVAGQWDVTERFAKKEDPYIAIASRFYGFPVTKDNPRERGTGKQLELSCGYGAGAATIKATAAKGTYGPSVQISDEDALRARDLYRSTHPAVVALWKAADILLRQLAGGWEGDWRGFQVRNKRLYLPNGLFLNYESLHWHEPSLQDMEGSSGWRLNTRRGAVRMYGPKLVENLIQALSRCHISGVWQELIKARVKVVSMEHDKLIACVQEEHAHNISEWMGELMCRPPAWADKLPLDSEGYVSHTFKREK
jgi:DNA polymerase